MDDHDQSTCSDVSEEFKSRALNLDNVLPPKLVLVSLDDTLDALSRMLDLESKLAAADPKYHQYHLKAFNLACRFLVQFHEHVKTNPLEYRQLAAANSR